MNILSMLSFTNFILFVIGTLYSLEHIYKSKLAFPLMLDFSSLAIWCLGGAFFYVAPDINHALFWYRFGSIGWITFPATSLHFFLLLTKSVNKLKYEQFIFLIYIIPAILLIENILLKKTLLITCIVQSSIGLGWTVMNSVNNLWLWVYISYLIIYIVGGLILVRKWGKLSSYFSEKKHSSILIFVSSVALAIGLYTDIINPLISIFIPPVANITIVVLIFSSTVTIKRYSLFYDTNIVTSETILNTIKDALIVFDTNFKIVKINQATTKLLGYNLVDIQNKELTYILANHKYNEENVKMLFKNKTLRNQEINLITAESKIINTIYSASIAENKYGEFLGYIITFKDITDRKTIENQLKTSNCKYKKLVSDLFKAANYDSLTGLPNRRIFFNKLSSMVNTHQKLKKDFVVIYMDLNGFKKINDTYGHDIGDYVLLEAANRLKKSIKKNEILARIGGDEFVMIIPNSLSKEIIDDRVNLIKKLFFKRIETGEICINISISIGYSLFSDSDGNIDDLVKNADIAMYHDKSKNKINRT